MPQMTHVSMMYWSCWLLVAALVWLPGSTAAAWLSELIFGACWLRSSKTTKAAPTTKAIARIEPISNHGHRRTFQKPISAVSRTTARITIRVITVQIIRWESVAPELLLVESKATLGLAMLTTTVM